MKKAAVCTTVSKSGCCDGVLFTHRGLEVLAAQDTVEILDRKESSVKPIEGAGVVLCSDVSFLDLCRLTYYSQIASSVILLLAKSDIVSLESVCGLVSAQPIIAKIQGMISGNSFAVRVRKEKGCDVQSQDWERKVGEIIFDSCKSDGVSVDLENPQRTIVLHITDAGVFFGVDLAGFDLSKRSYKIFLHTDSIKSTVAYSLVRLSGFSKKKLLLDPYTKGGSIPIEAALYALSRSPHSYERDRFAFLKMEEFKTSSNEEKFFSADDEKRSAVSGIHAYDENARHVKAAERNAKIAGVNKIVRFSRIEIEWLDTKFEKDSFDCIAVNMQSPQQQFGDQKSEKKLLDELFYSAKYVLKKKGRLAILLKEGQDVVSVAAKHDLVLSDTVSLRQGMEWLCIQIFVPK